ncbi:MAG: hypothetical protein ABS938_00880 [Psychrobacillus psychrodurans]|uniref:hypothetical protein n=1 Tax=Psychrobacillus sp. MER TA 171 TaxID=2939577 RepID=UPI00203B7323|nr:hypothetical protein [Psychrobacillus sp. MER TA 171]MCM3357166.1 hypothetical protein [Psychrobacillus sp. MER TA 171]
MGLFINDSQHPGVFKNNGELKASNQVEFRSNYLSDFMLSQEATNQSVLENISRLNNSQQQYGDQQITHWNEINKRLEYLKDLNMQHEQVEKQIQTGLQKLEQQNEKLHHLITEEQLGRQRLMEHIEHLDETNHHIKVRLDSSEETNGVIVKKLDDLSLKNVEVLSNMDQMTAFQHEAITKIDEQHQFHHTIAQQMSGLEESQKGLTSRVDLQEGLLEKIMRQIDHIRFSLYERTNFIEEKMEKLYQTSIASFQKIKNGSN